MSTKKCKKIKLPEEIACHLREFYIDINYAVVFGVAEWYCCAVVFGVAEWYCLTASGIASQFDYT